MNDKFLYDARPKIRRGFAQTLYAKLQDDEPQPNRWQAWFGNRATVVTSALALLLLAAVAYQILSPRFHHEAHIDGIDIYEMDYRIVLKPDWAAPLVEDGAEPLSEPGEARQLVSVFSIMEQLPYEIKLPTYVPEGMEMSELSYDDPSVWSWLFHLNWGDSEHKRSFMLMVHEVGERTMEEIRVAPGAWELVDLGAVQGVLVRGNFEPPFDSEEEYLAFADAEERFTHAYWNEALGLRLLWVDNGVFYELVSPVGAGFASDFKIKESLEYMYPKISEAELIRIAKSIVSQSD